MQIKLLSLATLAVLFSAVSAAPPPESSTGIDHQPGQAAGGDYPLGGDQSRSVPGSGDEAAFNARVQAIQNNPEIKNTLDFLIQQIAAELNKGAPGSSNGAL